MNLKYLIKERIFRLEEIIKKGQGNLGDKNYIKDEFWYRYLGEWEGLLHILRAIDNYDLA